MFKFLPKKNEYELEKIYNDGSTIILKKYTEPSNTKTIVCIPGTTGDTENKLIAKLIDTFQKKHYNIIFIICQGQQIIKNVSYTITKPQNISINNISDYIYAINYIKTKYNNIILMGISLGAFFMKKYLYIDDNITCAISISSIWNLPKTFDDWNNSIINKNLYDKFFVNYFKKGMQQNINRFEQYEKENSKFNIEKFMNSSTLKEVIAHLNDDNIDNAIIDIDKIKVPILHIHCKDDPVANYQNIPIEKILKNNKDRILLYNKGGHAAYMPKVGKHILNFIKNITS
jgi:predicted alpha/beta-fold hydrolase